MRLAILELAPSRPAEPEKGARPGLLGGARGSDVAANREDEARLSLPSRFCVLPRLWSDQLQFRGSTGRNFSNPQKFF
jgi:hypothetical protein